MPDIHHRSRCLRAAPALLALGLLGASATAAVAQGGPGAEGPDNLDINIPNTLDDAFAADRGSLELQGAARYDRIRGHDVVRFFPRLQLGVTDRLQAAVSLPYTVGEGPRARQGDAGIGLLYNLNQEGPWLPAFALALDASAPIGPREHSGELRLTGIASKTIDPAAHRRLHVNLTWFRRFDPSEEERLNRYRVTLGYSQLLSSRTALVANYLRESQERGERDANILEAGLRHQVAKGVILGGALGTGIGRDSPRFRAILSVQFSLSGS